MVRRIGVIQQDTYNIYQTANMEKLIRICILKYPISLVQNIIEGHCKQHSFS